MSWLAPPHAPCIPPHWTLGPPWKYLEGGGLWLISPGPGCHWSCHSHHWRQSPAGHHAPSLSSLHLPVHNTGRRLHPGPSAALQRQTVRDTPGQCTPMTGRGVQDGSRPKHSLDQVTSATALPGSARKPPAARGGAEPRREPPGKAPLTPTMTTTVTRHPLRGGWGSGGLAALLPLCTTRPAPQAPVCMLGCFCPPGAPGQPLTARDRLRGPGCPPHGLFLLTLHGQ